MADPTRPPAAQAQDKGTNWRLWAIGAIVVVLAIIALQNSQEVEVELLLVETTAPLIAILLISAALGAAIGYLAPVLRRHRRQERHREESE